ncbi:UpxY family transcription antiterminator [Mucilaginibacter sp. Bleaf8]|uniref:UpxY family transcription antiterminator n=1 Tax=Mucilaginibacter sp. Bleaf8 TaxID=2834430 RepID=UPI001BCE889D|nr:UpxY family transcription antiterminator [Mucilaginibacter sp. Bleaf8]MBS7566825.1 UpxY family transcription antiterminator [Mucilaginibacter sp. Bleaf8]
MRIIKSNDKPSNAKRWMVVYTRSKWEKKADKLLKNQGVTSFCPLIKRKSAWSDRIKTVEVPLFNSYLFVHISPLEQDRIQQTPGIVSFVRHCNKPVVLEDGEINRINTILQSSEELETVSVDRYDIGDTVKINEGPLVDYEGRVLKIQGKSVLLVLEKLGCAVVVKVDRENLN